MRKCPPSAIPAINQHKTKKDAQKQGQLLVKMDLVRGSYPSRSLGILDLIKILYHRNSAEEDDFGFKMGDRPLILACFCMKYTKICHSAQTTVVVTNNLTYKHYYSILCML